MESSSNVTRDDIEARIQMLEKQIADIASKLDMAMSTITLLLTPYLLFHERMKRGKIVFIDSESLEEVKLDE